MRKKFVQTLAAQQLELSSHIRTHDMELEKESSRAQQQRTQSGSGPEDVIEIIDDDQEVELMMERHRKYHPRKYVNLQQPTSKVYYDKIDTTNMSPAPDKEDQDMEEEDEDKLMVIDCAKEGTQTKEPNNNSVTAPNGNSMMPQDSSIGEPPGPVRHPSRANNALTGRAQSNDHQIPSSYHWHAMQDGGHLGRKHPELRQHLLHQREKVLRSRTGTPATFMYQQQQQYAPPPYQRSQRSHPYDRRHTSDSSSTITTPSYGAPQSSDGRNTATPHPRASQPQRSPTVGGIPAGISLGGAADGRKSAFSSPQDKRHRDATMMPPPTIPLPGSISSVAIAPRTPFYQHHHPYVQPPYHYPAFSANTPTASTYHTLEEWYRAGYPAPHLLSPTELQYYYHCYLSKIVLSSPGYHPHDPHYRDYPSLAMTPGAGTAYYPPPQYGFAKPGAVVADRTPHVAVPSSTAGGVVPTVPAAYPANQPIDFSQYNDRNVPTHDAGFLPATVSSASTAPIAITSQSPSSTSYTTAPSTTLHYTAPQTEAARPSVINRAAAPPAKGSPTAAHASSLMPSPTTTATMPQPQPLSTTSLPSTVPSPTASLPSTMLSPSSMPSPTRHPPPPPPPSMPSLSSTSHPPPTSTSASMPNLSSSSMMPPPPTRHPPPPSMPSLTSAMPPPSSPSSSSSTRRALSDMAELPPPLPATSVLSGAFRSERTDPRADLPPSVRKPDTNLGSNSIRNDPQSDYSSNSSEEPSVIKRTRRSTLNKPPASRYEQCDPTPLPHTPKRRGRRPSVATYNKASSQTGTTHSEAAAAQSNTNGERNIGALLQQMRREMMSFLQQRRSDIISTMRIYTIGRMDFGGFLVEMKRHSVTYRDFMHVAFILMRRCGYSGFAMEPPAELDYRWKNPPQDFADYFAKNEQCNKQFVAENFDFLLLIVDNLLQQYCEPMEFFLLTYVLGLREK